MTKLLQYTVLLLLAVNILSTILIVQETERTLQAATARAAAQNAGQVSFCLNRGPTLIIPCSPNMTEHALYTCQLNASDPNNATLSYFQIPRPPDNVTAPVFNISPSGLINFTPGESAVGNHSTLIGIDDRSGCSNAFASALFNFTVMDVDEPPYLIRPIPNQSLPCNSTLYAFFLRDYFTDADREDIFNFSFITGTATVRINVTINNDSSVVFTGTQSGRGFFIFRATDLSGLYADSNVVQVDVSCQPRQPGTGGQTGTGGGGGGGGIAPPCTSELICLPWSDCYPNGLQVQVCRDKNGCSQTEIRFYQNCTYAGVQPSCQENWLCNEWSVCSMEGKQNRTCTDLHECETVKTRPPLTQECIYQPTCFDGVQNGNETGVDCGGPCPPCKTIQQPTVFTQMRSWTTLLTLLLLLILAILLALFTLYREKVYEGLAELGWLFARRRAKEVLLTPGEKRLLFEDLALLEKELKAGKLAPGKAYERLSVELRKYYSFALDLPFEYAPEEFLAAFAAAHLSDALRQTLGGFAGRLTLLESGLLPADALHATLFSSIEEEFRLLICMTSLYDLAEIERDLPERHITPRLSFFEEIRLRLLNGYEALQFLKLGAAQEEYLAILRAYDSLPEKAKAFLYPDIRRFYLEIAYVQETSE
jgi:hypothetical protein